MSTETPLNARQPIEGVCEDCDFPYGVWFAPNEVWNRVVKERMGMLCPNCFITRAKRAGIVCTGWELRPENYEQETSHHSPASAESQGQNAKSDVSPQPQSPASERSQDSRQTLNASQWPHDSSGRDRMSRDLAQTADGQSLTMGMAQVCHEYGLTDDPPKCERCGLASALLIQLAAHRAIENVRRAVLAEAERALRERKRKLVEVEKYEDSEMAGLDEAIDVIAGMQ